MRKTILAGAAMMAVSGVAQAAPPPTVIFTPGVYTIPPFTSAQTFENFGNGGVADGSQFATSEGPYAETKTGDVRVFPGTQNQVGVAIPVGDAVDPYLAILNGTFNIAFGAAGVTLFSFAFGSLDNYNSVAITTRDAFGSTTTTYTGRGITSGLTALNTVPGTAPASFNDPLNTGRITYDTAGLSVITNVTFGSTQAAFEIDSLAAAVPEPSTWALMIMGFGVVGSALRTRRRKLIFGLS